MTMTAPQLTEGQRQVFANLGLDQFDNLALVSATEKTSGKHRALIMAMQLEGDAVLMAPVAMILEPDDIDLFNPPDDDVQVI